MTITAHHYAIDASNLLIKCQSSLQSILDCCELFYSCNNNRLFRKRVAVLIELNDALRCTERLLHTHLLDLLDREMEFLSLLDQKENLQFFGQHSEFPSLSDTVSTLICAERIARKYKKVEDDGILLSSSAAAAALRNSPKKSSHQRILSESAIFSNNNNNLGDTQQLFLDIDDPVESDNDGGGWYFGGRTSPPPTTTTTKITSDPILHHDIHIPNKPISPSRHCRNYSAGNIIDSPTRGGRLNGKSSIDHPTRSAKDSTLFRLIVTLQLCLVRIEEANSILCEGKASPSSNIQRERGNSDVELSFIRTCTSSNSFDCCDSVSSSVVAAATDATAGSSNKVVEIVQWKKSTMFIVTLGLGVTYYYYSTGKIRNTTTSERIHMLKSACKVSVGLFAAKLIRKRWRILCMNARVSNSAEAIQDWIFSWICLVNENSAASNRQLFMPEKYNSWYSIGSIRFQLIKRGMDVFYASIGKAIELTRGQQESSDKENNDGKSSGLWTYVVASLAASYYNVIGPAAKSAQVVQNARGAQSVIQNAWGVVSLPAVKKASLEATRILKGASIADRIEIDGISCFVLSRAPFPALASALRRYRRQQQREDVRLGTIHEQLSFGHASVNVSGFVRRDVIFHLTGGGFFAHTIAGDLPYLLDWSAATDSVIIIPEYALLPKHKFPDAIAEVTQIYRALRCGQAATLLGFQAGKIIVSGESAGGNLAAALCVTIIMDRDESECVQLTPSRSVDRFTEQEETFEEDDEDEEAQEINEDGIALPDALMMSCPALNLSLEPSPSRLVGADDPVLPSGLITVISNSYLPVDGEFSKTHPIASPYFASDETLSQFPPTLIFTSYEDPFLDDSVNFNARLRGVGVKSRLRAIHHMPHAFWALSTAGISEARQVQQECMDWLKRMFRHHVLVSDAK